MPYPDEPDPLQADLVYYYSGSEDCHPGKHWTSVRDHFLFHYILSGSGSVRVHGVDTPVAAGQGFLFHPREMSSYTASNSTPWSYAWVAFQGRRAASFVARWNLQQDGHLYTSCQPADTCRELTQLIPGLARCSSEFDQLARIYQVFALLERHSLPPRGAGPTVERADRFMARVFEYIRRNFARSSMSVEQLASHLGVSRAHLCHLVREHSGKTPRDLMMDYRMETAKELLANSDLTVAQVAWSVGYDDQLAFSRAFSHHEGLPPRVYRAGRPS